jgi:hypothetical protein
MVRNSCFLLFVLAAIPSFTLAQSQPASDAQALAYAAQSIIAMTGNATISDVTLTGSVTWILEAFVRQQKGDS